MGMQEREVCFEHLKHESSEPSQLIWAAAQLHEQKSEVLLKGCSSLGIWVFGNWPFRLTHSLHSKSYKMGADSTTNMQISRADSSS
ncbi:hypothetical protein LINPERHAP1_LOCUS33215 [Linum perenne]